ncbi:MAG: toxin-antitoxin system YwqK family antitoxin [Algicola sp.]|nr:toxin-antitoxin system YwqK family antitoxin [Algicola sp.]
MRKIVGFIGVLLLVVNGAFAQAVNQFDANGKRHGIWKKNFEGTQVLRYQGEFNHGKEVGEFKFYKNVNNKAVLTASKQFKADSDIALTTFYASNGKVVSKGQAIGKTRIGKWTYFHNNSDKIMTQEHYNSNGNLDGESMIYYENGQMAEHSHFKDGKLHGQALWYDESGALIKEYNYIEDKLHGKANFYGPKGELKLKGQYKNDRRDGIWTYYKNGVVEKEEDYTRRSKNPYKKQQ